MNTAVPMPLFRRGASIVALIAIAPLLSAVIPVLLIRWPVDIALPSTLNSSLQEALVRSSLVVIATGGLAMILGLVRTISCLHHRGVPTAIDFALLTPLLAGEISLGFVFKYAFAISNFGMSQAGPWSAPLYYAVIVGVYGMLLGQLLYVVLGSLISGARWLEAYWGSLGVTGAEKMVYYWQPQSHWIVLLVLLIVGMIAGEQSALSTLAFKPSPAQQNELWPHVVSRVLRLFSSTELRTSIVMFSLVSIISAAVIAVVSISASFGWQRMSGIICKIIGFAGHRLTIGLDYVIRISLWSLSIVILGTSLYAALADSHPPPPTAELTTQFGVAFLLALIVGTTVAVAAFRLAMCSRWRSKSPGYQSMIFVFAFLIVALYVPRSLVAQGILTVRLVMPPEVMSEVALMGLWVVAHFLAWMPVGLMFAFVSISGIDDKEWTYLRSIGLTENEVFSTYVLFRYWKDCLLLGVFVLTFALMDDSINSIFSDIVLSLSQIILNGAEGRSASMLIAGAGTFVAFCTTCALLIALQLRISRSD